MCSLFSKMKSFHIVYIFILLIHRGNQFNLSQLIENNYFTLQHVTIYYVHAFLCIKNNLNVTYHTLIETTWPENLISVAPKPFPNNESHAVIETDCDNIQQAKSTFVDALHQLWVLDVGNTNCSPKVIVYDLRKKNIETFRFDLMDYDGQDFLTLTSDSTSNSRNDFEAFITLNQGNFIIALSLSRKKVRKLRVTTGNQWNPQSVHVSYLAFTHDHGIFMSNVMGDLYIAHSYIIENNTEIRAYKIGNLIGKPKHLITDRRGYLYYTLPIHGAVLRWNPHKHLNAEGHDVLYFESAPIAQLFFGVKGSVWLALENAKFGSEHCVRIIQHYSATPALI